MERGDLMLANFETNQVENTVGSVYQFRQLRLSIKLTGLENNFLNAGGSVILQVP